MKMPTDPHTGRLRPAIQPHAVIRTDCTFCQEIAGLESYFSILYESHLDSRFLWEDSDFVVFPAIGQIVPGWLLVAPKRHVETISRLRNSELSHLESLLDRLKELALFKEGYLAYEHGAQRHTGASCGIYHAHIHLVPMAGDSSASSIHQELSTKGQSLAEVFHSLRLEDEYLICQDSQGVVHTLEPIVTSLPSQYVRQRVAMMQPGQVEWDWRSYGVEQALLSCVRDIQI